MDMPFQILVASSELEHRRALLDVLNAERWVTICASAINECEEVLATRIVSAVFCERRLPDCRYQDVLSLIRSSNKDIPLVVTSRTADWDEYLEALGHGAFDLIATPCDRAEAIWVTLRALDEEQERRPPSSAHGHSRAAKAVAAGGYYAQF